uniref:Sen15 n=1 Tax=Puccinia cf. psidii AE-2014 TaxID=1505670 RepID=A0A060IMZ5_9BASI|nr:Sen15 [Puccinia cf. psidii AE-2014]
MRENHLQYQIIPSSLKEASDSIPQQAAALSQALSDLTAGRHQVSCPTYQFINLEIVSSIWSLKSCHRTIYPMCLNQPTHQNFDSLSQIFSCLDSNDSSPKVLLAIVSNDSSIVYYELSNGIVSPKEVPE